PLGAARGRGPDARRAVRVRAGPRGERPARVGDGAHARGPPDRRRRGAPARERHVPDALRPIHRRRRDEPRRADRAQHAGHRARPTRARRRNAGRGRAVSWRRGAVALAIAVVAVAGLVLAARWWLFSRTHVGTDDAYVHADVAMVTPRIAGTVDRIYVDANWEVRRGQLLVRIDPAEQRPRLQRAEAALAHAREGVRQARAAVRASDAGLALAEADLEQARIDHSRAAQLAGGGVVPTERLDRARTALRVAEARVASARGEATRARATL